MNRIVIIGHPMAGKSTLAKSFGLPVFCTDTKEQTRQINPNAIYLPGIITNEHLSNYVMIWMTNPRYVIEGVGAVRALRKWASVSNTYPCDKIIFMKNKSLESKHIAMAKAIDTIWAEIEHIYSPITEYR